MTCWGQKRRVNKADGHVRFTPDLVGRFSAGKIDELQPYAAPRISSHDVIYYSGDELPRTQDLGGSEAGRAGEAGGEEARHRTQTIKVARGGSLVPKVVDAPNLKLPSSSDAVANLLAIRPDAGPPPSEGLRSTRSAESFFGRAVGHSAASTSDEVQY